MQVRTEALTESEAQTQAEAQMQAQIQAKRVAQRPRRKEATVKCSVERQESNRDGGRQEAQRQDEAELCLPAWHRRGGETRSQTNMVDRNSVSVERVSLSDIFSSSGALPFRDELKDPGVFIPEHASADKGGTRR